MENSRVTTAKFFTRRDRGMTSQLEDRVAGCIYGSAIGDAMGAAFEFVDSCTIERHLGEPIVRSFRPAVAGSLLFMREPGRPTDDTAMALSVLKAVASGEPLTPALFARRFLTDLERGSGPIADMFWTGGPGIGNQRALARLRRGADPATCGGINEAGNGAVMRVHPVGVLADRDAVLHVAAVQTRVTHGHPAAVAAAQAVAALVHDALAGKKPSAGVPAGVTDATFAHAWRTAHAAPFPAGGTLPEHLRDVPMNAWTTVATAHAISLRYASPLEAIGRAAASGVATDTVAAIVGALVGARYGMAALRPQFVAGLNDGGIVRRSLANLLTSLSNWVC